MLHSLAVGLARIDSKQVQLQLVRISCDPDAVIAVPRHAQSRQQRYGTVRFA
jgi:hypothetical protein